LETAEKAFHRINGGKEKGRKRFIVEKSFPSTTRPRLVYFFLAGCTVGSSDFDKIFENCYASCSFGLAKDIKDYFRKGTFLYFVAFLSFLGFCVAKFY
jgi:hypothetical protein